MGTLPRGESDPRGWGTNWSEDDNHFSGGPASSPSDSLQLQFTTRSVHLATGRALRYDLRLFYAPAVMAANQSVNPVRPLASSLGVFMEFDCKE